LNQTRSELNSRYSDRLLEDVEIAQGVLDAAQEKAAAGADAGPGGSSPVTVGVNGEIVDGGAAKAAPKKKGK